MNIYMLTLGCKVNQYESQSLQEAWLKAGYSMVTDSAQADCIVVNSCAVTAKAMVDLRNNLRRLHRLAPHAKIILSGCAAELLAEEDASFTSYVHILPQQYKEDLLCLEDFLCSGFSSERGSNSFPSKNSLEKDKAITEAFEKEEKEESSRTSPYVSSSLEDILITETLLAEEASTEKSLMKAPLAENVLEKKSLEESSSLGGKKIAIKRGFTRSSFPHFSIENYTRSRAVVKIQDGCSHYCSYCIVPSTRGTPISRPLEDSLQELERLFEAGIAELTINGINLGQYGKDLKPQHDIWDFLYTVEERFSKKYAGKVRLRLSSVSPADFSGKAFDYIRESQLLAPHLHLSVQSGSASVLRRMGRGQYDAKHIYEIITKVKERWPLFALGLDIIAGFPGESPEEFAESYALLESLPLSYGHVFPYSSRPGTKAASFPEGITKQEKQERAALLRKVCEQKEALFLQKLAALPHSYVVFEKQQKDATPSSYLKGLNEFYVTCRLAELDHKDFGSKLIKVQCVAIQNNELVVKPADD